MSAVALAATSACGDDDSGSSAEGARQVTLRLPLLAIGYTAPFFLAKNEGLYEEAGLEVEIGEGKGSPVTSQTVANGSDDFGFVDGATAAKLIAEGADMKIIAGIQPKGSPAVVYRPPIEIKSAEDLVGHPIIGTGGNNDLLIQAVLAKAGMSIDDLEPITAVQAASAKQAFLDAEDALYLSNVNADAAALKVIDDSVQTTLYSDLGVNMFGYSLIASNTMIEEEPETVRAFVQASMEAWSQAEKDQQPAVDALLKDFPDQDPDQALRQLVETTKLMHTPATEGESLGFVAESDLQETLDHLAEYLDVTSTKPTTDYYTNEFL